MLERRARSEHTHLMDAGLATAAIGNGLALVVLVYATAGISGGHLNPAVSTAFLITGRCAPQSSFPGRANPRYLFVVVQRVRILDTVLVNNSDRFRTFRRNSYASTYIVAEEILGGFVLVDALFLHQPSFCIPQPVRYRVS